MAFLPPALAAAGTFLGSTAGVAALTAGTALFTGYTAIQQGKYQAAVARNNAVIAEENAAAESEAAQRTAMRSDQEYAALLGEQLAQQGASGFDILGRTQSATRMMTRRTGRNAAEDIIDQGNAAARRLAQDAANFRGEASAANTQGWVTGISSVLDGARSIGRDLGATRSLASRGGRRKPMPWDKRPNWYGHG